MNRVPYGLLLISAVGSAFAYSPLSLGWLILFMPALWFRFLLTRSPKAGFGWGWLWAMVYGMTLGYPLTYLIHLQTGSVWLTGVGWVMVVALQGLFFGMFGWLAARAPQKRWLIPFWLASTWTLCQWARGLGEFAFMWGTWAVVLAPYPLLLQVLDLGGAWGLEWLIAFINGCWAVAYLQDDPLTGGTGKGVDSPSQGKPGNSPLPLRLGGGLGRGFDNLTRGTWGMALLTLACWLGYGLIGKARVETWMNRSGAPRVPVAIIQPNLDLTRLYTEQELESYREGAFRQMMLLNSPASLIVLPESFEPYPLPEEVQILRQWQTLAQETGCNLLTGGYRIGDSKTGRFTNTAHLFLARGGYQFHDKVKLVPLGETVPLRQYLPFLTAFGVVTRDLLPGEQLKPMAVDAQTRAGVVVCMESTFPWVSRGLTTNGANLLVLISNESWFGRTAALDQHAAFTVLRAVETRRAVVRSAPQGVSGFYYPDGTYETLPVFQAATQVRAVPLLEVQTLYVRFGDWIIIVSVILLSIASLRSKRDKFNAAEL